MNPALYKLLEAYYRRRRAALLILAGVCLVVIFGAVGWGVSKLLDDPPSSRCPRRSRAAYAACCDRYDRDVYQGMGVFTVLPGLFIALAGIGLWPLRDMDHAPLVRVFTSRREEVAWIYPRRTSVRRYGVEVRKIHTVVVGLTNRKRVSLTVRTEAEAQEAVRLMAVEAPRAARGYGAEVEAKFLRDPASVLSTRPSPPTVQGLPVTPAAPVRMVAAPDCPFARIDTGVRYLGLALEPGLPAPPPASRSPRPGRAAARGSSTPSIRGSASACSSSPASSPSGSAPSSRTSWASLRSARSRCWACSRAPTRGPSCWACSPRRRWAPATSGGRTSAPWRGSQGIPTRRWRRRRSACRGRGREAREGRAEA